MQKQVKKLGWNHKSLLFKLYIIAVILSTVIAVLILVLPSKTAYAIEEEKKPVYTSIMIRPGDSLWSIAKEYYTQDCNSIKEYIELIKSCNSLYDDTIHAGCYLVIPYYDDSSSNC